MVRKSLRNAAKPTTADTDSPEKTKPEPKTPRRSRRTKRVESSCSEHSEDEVETKVKRTRTSSRASPRVLRTPRKRNEPSTEVAEKFETIEEEVELEAKPGTAAECSIETETTDESISQQSKSEESTIKSDETITEKEKDEEEAQKTSEQETEIEKPEAEDSKIESVELVEEKAAVSAEQEETSKEENLKKEEQLEKEAPAEEEKVINEGNKEKGKGKSKGKNKSKVEGAKLPVDVEPQIQNQISENVQASPVTTTQNNNRVDNDGTVSTCDEIVESVPLIKSENNSTTSDSDKTSDPSTNDNKNNESIEKCVEDKDQKTNSEETNADNKQTEIKTRKLRIKRGDSKQKDNEESEKPNKDCETIESACDQSDESIPEKVQEKHETVENEQKEETTKGRRKIKINRQPSKPVEEKKEVTDATNNLFDEKKEIKFEEKNKSVDEICEMKTDKQDDEKKQNKRVHENNESKHEKRIRISCDSESNKEETIAMETGEASEENSESSTEPGEIPKEKLKLKRVLSGKEERSEEFEALKKWDADYNQLVQLCKITTEDFGNLFGQIDLLEEEDVKLEIIERISIQNSGKERKVSIENSDGEYEHSMEKSEDQTQEENIIALNRKISIVDDTASKLRPPPSPAKNPVSSVLFITNLVRPFTLKQLREMLERTGKIQENGLWTDKIKSKCYVQYETEEEAETTRNAIHGVNWPIGNGKKLVIEYSTPEEMENAQNPPAPIIPKVEESSVQPEKENLEPEIKKHRISESENEKKENNHVREWDVGKDHMRRGSRSRSRSRDRNEKRRHRRSPSPRDDYPRKQKKIEDPVPQKLMDDLFQKTKAMPSIFWLPLSPEEISLKQQQRLQRMAEHKRRMEETSQRNRPDFNRQGGPYRRRYD